MQGDGQTEPPLTDVFSISYDEKEAPTGGRVPPRVVDFSQQVGSRLRDHKKARPSSKKEDGAGDRILPDGTRDKCLVTRESRQIQRESTHASGVETRVIRNIQNPGSIPGFPLKCDQGVSGLKGAGIGSPTCGNCLNGR